VLRGIIDSCSASPQDFDADAPELPQSISIRLERGLGSEGERHTVRLMLPRRYPSERALCNVEWDGGTRAQRDYINGVVSQYAESLVGEEMCYALVSKVEELIGEEVRDMEDSRNIIQSLVASQRALEDAVLAEPPRMKRVLIFFHHIIANGKREAVRDWAIELKLGGYSKIGWSDPPPPPRPRLLGLSMPS